MPPKKTTTATKKAPSSKPAAGAAKKAPAKPAAKGKEASAKPASKEKEATAVTDKMASLKMVEGIEISLKEITAVSNGKNEKINESKRWPFVIDPSERAAVFLRHRDCNMLDALDKDQMVPERIRLALLGGLRFGKPLVIDLMGSDVWNIVEEGFNGVQKGLLDSVFDKSILQEDKYSKLVDDEKDGPEYTNLHEYNPQIVENFVFIILTTKDNLPENIKCKTITVTVV